MNFTKSEALHQEALEHIVGGVNSPSRSFKAVGGGSPVAMARGEGAYFWDVDGNQYIDYLAAYGPIITGHAHPHITKAITKAAQNGVLFGTQMLVRPAYGTYQARVDEILSETEGEKRIILSAITPMDMQQFSSVGRMRDS